MKNSTFRHPLNVMQSALIITAIVAAFSLPSSALAQRGAAAVVVDTVARQRIHDTQTILGRIVATRRSDIATRIAGVVKSVSFKVGDRVARGSPLVTLDGSRFEIEKRANEAAISAADAAVAVARAKLALVEQGFKRQAGLKESTAFSRSRFDDLRQSVVQSRSELTEAIAKLHIAKVGLERAIYELEHTAIIAPFDGIVVIRQAQPGQYVQAGGTVASLLDTTDLEIVADVPGAIANGLQAGSKLEVVFDNGIVRPAIVRTAIPLENRSTRTRAVRFNADLGGMQPSHIVVGGNVALKVPVSAARKVTTVPKDALLRGRDGWMVFAVVDNKAEPRPVELGQAVLDRMEVISGLIPGDVVVVRGNERLRPGQAVSPRPAAATPTTPAKQG
jgi:RND family efflux transporter MFP subunit